MTPVIGMTTMYDDCDDYDDRNERDDWDDWDERMTGKTWVNLIFATIRSKLIKRELTT